ncbi:hypothetical protein T4D_9648, partial [Trichinella pseudospiralis]
LKCGVEFIKSFAYFPLHCPSVQKAADQPTVEYEQEDVSTAS